MYLRDGSGDGADHCGHDVGVLPESSDPAERGDLPAPIFEFVLSLQSVTQELHTAGSDMREHVLLICLLGLVLTAAIILAIAPGAVTWALALIE